MAKKYKYRERFMFDGKTYSVYADTKTELAVKKTNKLRDLQEGKVNITGHTTVREWTTQALDVYKKDISYEHRKHMECQIEKYILSEIGDRQIKDIKPIECQRILNSAAGLSKSYIAKLNQELFFIFDTAVDNQLILKNPAAKLIRPDGSKTSRRSLTDVERKHFLLVCEQDPAYRLFQLMYYCGCRPTEAINVQGLDIQTKQDEHFLHIRGTKTVNADRLVPIPAVFYSQIVNTPPFSYIAPNRAGNRHTASSYRRLVGHLRRDMNISMGCQVYRNALVPPLPLSDDFVPYLLRHTYCTDLQKKGIDIRVAQKLMGHADISTTANIYTHQDEETIVQAAKIING